MPGLVQGPLSEYEKQRLQNIEENKRMLESLGLLRKFKPILQPIKKHKKDEPLKDKKIAAKRTYTQIINDNGTESPRKRRRSLRVKGIEPDGTLSLPDEEEDEEYKPRTPKIKRDNYFGPIEGIQVGTHWDTRMECSIDGVHRPTVAGIHGNESIGCFSIALSGGYEDDIDLGESFTYTGAGGRDLKGTKANPKNLRTAPQSKDQTLTKVNLGLSLNVETREPVRVIRGYKLQSPFAPDYGYRYDGLYTVEKCWSCTGLSGYLVWKYILKRCSDQASPPWLESQLNSSLNMQESDEQSEKSDNVIVNDQEKICEKEDISNKCNEGSVNCKVENDLNFQGCVISKDASEDGDVILEEQVKSEELQN